MQPGICLIAIESATLERFAAALSASGLAVWRAGGADAYATNPLHKSTLCLAIDMPGLMGLEVLEKLRSQGIGAPAVLVADADVDLPATRLANAHVLDVLQKPVNTRAFLGWIECLCVANMALAQEHALQAGNLQRIVAGPFSRRAFGKSAIAKTGT